MEVRGCAHVCVARTQPERPIAPPGQLSKADKHDNSPMHTRQEMLTHGKAEHGARSQSPHVRVSLGRTERGPRVCGGSYCASRWKYCVCGRRLRRRMQPTTASIHERPWPVGLPRLVSRSFTSVRREDLDLAFKFVPSLMPSAMHMLSRQSRVDRLVALPQ